MELAISYLDVTVTITSTHYAYPRRNDKDVHYRVLTLFICPIAIA